MNIIALLVMVPDVPKNLCLQREPTLVMVPDVAENLCLEKAENLGFQLHLTLMKVMKMLIVVTRVTFQGELREIVFMKLMKIVTINATKFVLIAATMAKFLAGAQNLAVITAKNSVTGVTNMFMIVYLKYEIALYQNA